MIFSYLTLDKMTIKFSKFSNNLGIRSEFSQYGFRPKIFCDREFFDANHTELFQKIFKT